MARCLNFRIKVEDGLRFPYGKTKTLISFAVTAKLICVFVLAHAKSRFSHNEAQFVSDEEQTKREEVTSAETNGCVDMMLAIAVFATIIVIILIAFLASLVVGIKLMNSMKQKRKRSH